MIAKTLPEHISMVILQFGTENSQNYRSFTRTTVMGTENSL